MKYKGVRVINKPLFLKIIPLFYGGTAQSIYPYVIVPNHIYNELENSKVNPKSEAVLNHEIIHIFRQKKFGVAKWYLKYLLSKKFRFEEEMFAILESMRAYKRYEIEFDTHKTAKFLSSWVYLWCVTYLEAKEKLDKAWLGI